MVRGNATDTPAVAFCMRWLTQLEGWERYAPRGRGVTARSCTKKLLLPWIKLQWADAADSSVSGEETVAVVGPLLAGAASTVVELLSLLRRMTDETMAEAARRDLHVTITQVAEVFAGVLGKKWAEGQVMSLPQLHVKQREYLASRVVTARKPSRKGFAKHRAGYEEAWVQRGQANLEAAPYSRLHLGDDEQPPFMVDRTENTFDGLNQSIYWRFSAAARDANVEGNLDEIAWSEVQRACEVLGLVSESARVMLRSLAAGFDFGPMDMNWAPPRVSPPIRDWSSDLRPLTVELPDVEDPAIPTGININAPLAAKAQANIVTFTTSTEMGRYLRMTTKMDEAAHDAMSRAWHDAHRADRRNDPMTGALASRIVVAGVMKGIVSGQRLRLMRRQRAEGPVPRTVKPPKAAADFAAGMAWLQQDLERAAELLHGNDMTRQEYRADQVEHGLPDLDDLVAYVRNGGGYGNR